jgi:hypothetical protein
MPVRLERYPIFGVSSDHSTQEEFVMSDALRHWRSHNPQKYYDGGLAGEVLKSPTSIFQGLQRRGLELSYCYCGKPPVRWTDAQVEAPSPPNMVLAFYIRPWEDGLWIWDWNWLTEDPRTPGHPEFWQDNFARRTWPTN